MFASLKAASQRTTGYTTLAVGALVIAFTLTLTHVQAAPITFTYEGAVSTTSGGAAFNAFLGQSATLEYFFDDTAPDTNPSGTAGTYTLTAALLTIGTSNWQAIPPQPPGTINVTNAASDSYSFDISSPFGPSIGGLTPAAIILSMSDPTGTALSSDALPSTQPDPADFATTNFNIAFVGGAIGGTIGIENFAIAGAGAGVPEPGALIVFGFGLLGLGIIRRRKTA
ncbi:MAG: PEP-CTERM sorting domain-containing protein [Alphaproteobacteria bacterium]|nr:PEP-CTERM sorting domain-containing protein [Alphaproteobacteria bacterium]